MLPDNITFFSKRFSAMFLLIALSFVSGTVLAQAVADTPIMHFVEYNKRVENFPFAITGRVIGANLESIKQAEVINICTGETTKADDNGIYHFQAAKGDTLAFVSPKYSATILGIKVSKDKFNIILIKRKADNLPTGYSERDYEKAQREDEAFYKILDKDAKEEGRWKY
jgi:hypothetical protein